jgi:beta-lactam-binding protein with PASTA domain
VPVVQLDPAALQNVLGQTTKVVAKVVSQSIQPGVSVAKGTTIDLVLAEPTSIKVSVLQNAFTPLANQTLDDVFKNVVRDNPQVQSVLARNQTAAVLSTADQATLTTALSNAGSPVTTDPGHTIDNAFHTLQAAFTFGT